MDIYYGYAGRELISFYPMVKLKDLLEGEIE